jgi:hypothetical protein
MVLLLAMDAEALEPCLEERTPSLALQVSSGWSKQLYIYNILYTFIQIYIYMYVCMQIYMYTYIYINVIIYIYTHVEI